MLFWGDEIICLCDCLRLWVGSIFLQQHHGVGADAFFTAGEAELLGGGGFDGDVIRVYAHDVGKGLLHLGNVGVEFGTLGTDGGIDVANGVASGGDDVEGLAEQNLGVDVLELIAFLGGEVVADVTHVGGAEDGIADGMDEDIGIGVSEQSEGVLYLDAAEPEGTTLDKLVDIVAKTDSYFHRECLRVGN